MNRKLIGGVKKHNDGGFTLIEVMVNINISLVLISLLISVYLFTSKLTSTSMKNLEYKTETITFLSNLYTALGKAENYIIQINDNAITLIIDGTNVTKFSENEIYNDILANLNDFDNYELVIIRNDGKGILYVDGAIHSDMPISKDGIIDQAGLKRIRLTIEKGGKEFIMSFDVPKYSISSFKNIADLNV